MSIVVLSTGSRRPAPRILAPLPPWDKSNPDGSGIVHTTPPPEFDASKLKMRGDFNGITLDKNKWPDSYFQSLNLKGVNTTPYQMIMSPMLILYPRPLQDDYLANAAYRNYSHITIAPDGWNLAANRFNMTTQAYQNFANYIRSWGFKVNGWRTYTVMNDPYISLSDYYVPGEEVDFKMTAEQYEAYLDNNLQYGVRLGAHFTDNYPLRAPRDTFLTNWNKYDGKVDLCWQAGQNDTAGTQGGILYYARQRVYMGLQGDGEFIPANAAPNSYIHLWEMQASNQLNGTNTEEYGCLRTLEGLYCPSGDSEIPMLSGFNNGCRYPDGSWV